MLKKEARAHSRVKRGVYKAWSTPALSALSGFLGTNKHGVIFFICSRRHLVAARDNTQRLKLLDLIDILHKFLFPNQMGT